VSMRYAKSKKRILQIFPPFHFSVLRYFSSNCISFYLLYACAYFLSLNKVLCRRAVLSSVVGKWIRTANLSEFPVTW